MTINLADNSPRVSYTVASGATRSGFAVPFEFFAKGDLNVYLNGVLKTLNTHYTVSGGNGSTGTVTMSVTGVSGGSSVVLTRSVPLQRTSDFPTSGPFKINALNTELDRLIAISADLQDQASRGLQLTDYDISANLVLPSKDDRKGTTLAFNAVTGAAEAGPNIADVQSVSAASADIQTLAHIEDGTDATDAIQTVAGIASNVTTVAGVSANVTTVAGSITNVNTVGTNIADVSSVATNMAEVLLADTNAATATTKASEASASAAAALASKNAASTSETNAASSETNAATSASTATTKASEASTSASNAATSETNAATSETNAATSEANAATSESNAATSADAALAALDNFDDRYLGQKASDPTLDNDGDALVAGALYFNTTGDVMKVYEGSVWVAAYASLSGALLTANNLSDVVSVSAARTNLGLATVASTGGYSDLTGLPALGTAAATASTDYATAAQGTLAGSAVQPNDSPTFADLTTTGNVLINRTSTDRAAKLRVDLASGTNGAAVYISRLGSTVSKAQIEFANDNGVVGSITTGGSSTSYNTSSDYRLKTDAQPMTGASARVQALKPVNFEWIADGTRVDGFLAHEAQEVVPEAVIGTKDAVDADGNPDHQGIDQSKLVPLLTAALQEALTKIDDMETRLAALEAV